MVIFDQKECRGNTFNHARSDMNVLIADESGEYEDVYWPIGIDRTFVETDKPIEQDVTESDKNAALRRFRVEV